MEIYAKSTLSHDQINAKKAIGCDAIEIQLLDEFIADNCYKCINEVVDLLEYENEPISVVHAPIIDSLGDLTIEQLCDFDDFRMLDITCEIAEFFSIAQNKNVIVVLHSETFLDFIIGIGGTLNRIEYYIDRLLCKYPHIKLAIENVTPLRGFSKGNIHLANNFLFDNVDIANKLRFDLNTERIGTVLDTCHAMITKKYVSALFREIGNIDHMPDLSMDSFFKENKDTVFLIHLASMRGTGFDEGHGTPFDNPQDCFDILDIYKKYNYSCPITLEVKEDDYIKNENYKATKLLVDKYIGGKGCEQ